MSCPHTHKRYDEIYLIKLNNFVEVKNRLDSKCSGSRKPLYAQLAALSGFVFADVFSGFSWHPSKFPVR